MTNATRSDDPPDFLSERATARLLARARAAITAPADIDDALRATLLEDIEKAEHRLARGSQYCTGDIHLGRVSHEGNISIFAAHCRETLLQQLLAYCCERWPCPAGLSSPDQRSIDRRLQELQHRVSGLTVSTWIASAGDHSARQHESLETGSYCVLGTAHLSAITANLLDRWCSDRSDGGPFLIARSVYGWFVPTRDVASASNDQIPDDLLAAMSFGRQRGYDHILFDCDAATVADLPVHDW